MRRLNPVFRGHMNARRDVVLEDRQAYYIWRCSFNDGQEIELILRKRQKQRTKNQNSYLWGIVYPIILESSGYATADEVHEAMKMKFLRVHRDGLPDTVRSTTDLTTAEFGEYVDNIKRWTSEFFGAYIPDAGEVD